MRIAIFRTDNSFLNIGQYNCQEIGLGKSLLDAGHEVFLILVINEFGAREYPDYISHGSKQINIIKVKHRVIPLLDYPLLDDIDRVFNHIQPNLCHINEESCPATIQVALSAKKHRVPVVIYHGMYLTPESRVRKLYEHVHNYLLRPWLRKNVKHVFAKTSRANKYLLERNYEKSTIMPVGLDVSCFSQRSVVSKEAALAYMEKKNVIYVGIFEKRRNIALLLDIARKYHDANVHFTLIGDGPEFGFAEEFVKSNKLTNVTLTGPIVQSCLPFYYDNASLFFMASNYEIFGMVYLEAMYFGLSIVTNSNAGSDDLVTSENGVVIDSSDSDIWVEKIESVLNRVDESSKVLIKKKFIDSFTWDRIALTYLSVVEPLVSAR